MKNREGRILRERRWELGMTQEEVAIELHMSIHQYQRYEYGESRLSETAMRIGLRICTMPEFAPYKVIFGGREQTARPPCVFPCAGLFVYRKPPDSPGGSEKAMPISLEQKNSF